MLNFDMTFRHRRSSRSGFSLVELLVVMGIISLLIVISATMLSEATRSGDLGNSADNIKDSLLLARQEALTQNRTTEFRVYRDKDDKLIAYQTMIVESGGNVPLSKVTSIPDTVDGLGSATHSNLLSEDTYKLDEDDEESWTYQYIRISPSGSADTPKSGDSTWTLTLVNTEHASATTLPDDYRQIIMQPLTGRVSIVRPEAE